jgi:GT2 family glycosyltransferase
LNGNTIERLIEIHKKYNEYGILSPIHLNGKGNKLDRNFSYYLGYDNNDTFYFDAVTSKLKDIYEVPFVNAAAWLLPKKTLEVVGGFDPIFFHYGEDDNYCQRVLFHRLKIGIVTNSFIMHDREHSLKQPPIIFSNQYFDEMEKNYKCKFTNVNYEDWENDIENELFKLKKLEIRSLIFLKFSRVKGYRRQINLLKRISLETRNSRHNNQLIKSNYLNL